VSAGCASVASGCPAAAPGPAPAAEQRTRCAGLVSRQWAARGPGNLMSARSFRVAVVGCGRISKNHFDAIRRVEGLSLSAVCDISADRAGAAGETLGVPSFVSYEDMLKAGEFDIASVCTPSGIHSSQGAA